MPFIPPEQVAKAKEMDLLTYLKTYEPGELVRISDREYCTRTHDSLKISNGKWMWWSQGIGGKSAVDYLVAVQGLSFPDAVQRILENKSIDIPRSRSPTVIKTAKKLILPRASPTNNIAKRYLMDRGIAENIIDLCIQNGSIYESLPMNNVVFVGFDEKHTPRYAAMRGTRGSDFKGDVYGSDKQYSFRVINPKSDTVHLFEGAVDLLSYMTLMQMAGRDWTTDNLISLDGVYNAKQYQEAKHIPVALSHFLECNPQIKTIRLHLDNDRAGRNAANAITTLLSDKYRIVNRPVPYGKDVNDYLCFRLKNRRKENREENKTVR